MSNQLDPFSSFFPSKGNRPLLTFILVVFAFHLILLSLGTYWHPTEQIPKPKPKIIVQTVKLKPFQSEIAQHSAAAPTALLSPPIPLSPPVPPIEQPNIEPLVQRPTKEEVPPPQPDPMIQKEETPPVQEISQPKEPPPITPKIEPIAAPTPIPVAAAAPPIPIKLENKPQPKSPPPKPAVKEPPKKDIKPAAPVKKSPEPVKKPNKSEAEKAKQAEEAEKKKQQELAEKKRQQEKAEVEKKRQQEIAEAQRKLQQEVALAQEVAKQKQEAAMQKMAMAKQNLAKIGETRDKITTSPTANFANTSLPKELGNLHVDALPLGAKEGAGQWGTKEASYSDGVAYRLKMNLKLPDYGAVKIKLTIDRNGSFKNVEIVQSESEKNKAYVKSKIPTMVFSPFGQNFQGVSQNTFVITLQNDS